ncbi:carbohydrate ABC transporter permease [Lysinibacillus endophyticus]|uniref:carbohydrate ABC transporter permease n=1 Tax=Ureibacillus endophyticus TaxID=1978490 RepID=UPI0020A04428|nr:carbohydrate ABC transporter permease [Lysinibacillus endophyticus]MCP1146775.1 carbohydrate ABC transporter permease [Lysinibacillus endophyticus]
MTTVKMNQKKRVNTIGLLKYFGVFAILLFLFVPILWIVLTAFKTEGDSYNFTVFFKPVLENFQYLFSQEFNIGKYYFNSVWVVFATLLITIPVSILAAYALSRFQMRGKQVFMFAILATQFIPLVVNLIPLFLIFRNLGMIDTTIALIIVNLGHTIPYAIWLIKGFIDRVPVDIEEAAAIDGANRFQIITKILIPTALPGIITATVFCFVITWNEFMFALILTQKEAVTLPIALSFFNGEKGVIWNQMAAAGIIFMLPTVIFMLLVRKQFVQGMTSGSVK